jgi:P-type Cu2+ transporter
MARMKSCLHCNTVFSPRHAEQQFCCNGCEYVHHIIQDQGLEQFYKLKQGLATMPVQSRPFEEHDWPWLPEQIAKAEAHSQQHSQGEAHLDVSLDGISCVGCVWLIETLFAKHPGAIRAAAHPAQGLLHLEWVPGRCDIAPFFKEIAKFGYVAVPRDAAKGTSEQQKIIIRVGLCGAFMLNAMAFSLPVYLDMPADFAYAEIFRLIAFLSATFAMLVGGTWFIKKAWSALRIGVIHIDLPIALGLLLAYIGSIIGLLCKVEGLMYFDFVATFVFLMLVGRALQSSAVEKNRHRLVRQQPVAKDYESADTTSAARIPLETITDGALYYQQPGQASPVASVIQSQNASFSLEWINGEAAPVAFPPGSRLPAGAILLSRIPVALRASEAWTDSLLARLTAPQQLLRGHAFLDKLLRRWLMVIFAIGIAGFFWHYAHQNWVTGLQVMISVFVVSCPCALGVAIPLADELAASKLGKLGVFLRNNTFWSRIRRVKHIIFDKTGTLTIERPILMAENRVAILADNAALALARLTQGSLHPISRSLLEHLGHRGQKLLETAVAVEVIEHPGLGVEFHDQNHHWSLGRAGWQGSADESPEQDGLTELRCDNQLVTRFPFADSLRPAATQVLPRLAASHLQLHILSGDQPEKVHEVAKLLSIPLPQARGGLLPEQKADAVRAIDQQNTLYLGDGANDSLAFDAAYVTGTPVTDRSLLESKSDFYTLGSGLSFLPSLFSIANQRAKAVRHAFLFAVLYNLTVVVLSLIGVMNPLLAAIVMPISSVISLVLVALALRQPRIAKTQKINASNALFSQPQTILSQKY